ncbi:unnamed protein product, partial [Ectocarpus sp. 4 AP-2014]
MLPVPLVHPRGGGLIIVLAVIAGFGCRRAGSDTRRGRRREGQASLQQQDPSPGVEGGGPHNWYRGRLCRGARRSVRGVACHRGNSSDSSTGIAAVLKCCGWDGGRVRGRRRRRR